VGEYLLAHGHPNALSYTLRQAITLFFFANKRIRGESLAQMNLMRVAYHADDKNYKKSVKLLG